MSFYDDASLIMFPSGYKEDKIYSLKPTDGSGDLTFTRASTATRVNSDGLIETSPVNLVSYSEQFDNAAWTKINATITSNSIAAPNGTTTADLITSTGTSETGVYIITSFTGTNTWSVYAKKGTGRYLFFNTNTPLIAAKFDLEDGVIVGTPSAGATPSIESVGDGWYRCIITSSTATNRFTVFVTNNTTTSDLTSSVGLTYYLWGAQINIGATAKPYFPTTDRLNVPRIDYTSGCGKLLLEPQRTNVFTSSENFSDSSWTLLASGETIVSNSTTSPDGYVNADTIQGDGTATNVYIRKDITLTTSVSYTFSVFAKKGNNDFLGVTAEGFTGATNDSVFFDLANGSVTSGTGTIQAYSNGWYKCSFTTLLSTDGVGRFLLAVAYDGTSRAFPSAGDSNGQNIYLYGASLEAGSYVSSYIPTLASSVTRLADAVSKTGISSLIGQTEGTLFAEIEKLADGTWYLTLSDGTVSNWVFIGVDGGNLRGYVRTSAGVQVDNSSTLLSNGIHKIAIAYKFNDVAIYLDGSQVFTTSSASAPSVLDRLNLSGAGVAVPQSQSVSGVVKQYLIFPTRLDNATLATLTTI